MKILRNSVVLSLALVLSACTVPHPSGALLERLNRPSANVNIYINSQPCSENEVLPGKSEVISKLKNIKNLREKAEELGALMRAKNAIH